jgi:hypothetical protein
MKKFIIAAFAAVCSIFSACADNDRIITFDQLPAAAQAIVQQYKNVADIAYVKLDPEFFGGDEYSVRFNDGKEFEFEEDGSLHKVDYQYEAVPEALVPEVVRQQVKASFPQALIVEWGKSGWGWKAELNNKIEIKFDRNLQMRGLDD